MKPYRKIHLDPSFYQTPGWVYFITIVSNLKTPYFLDEDLNKEIIVCLKGERERIKCRIYVFCLMPEHLHLLCGTNSQGVSILDFVNQFKGKSTRIGWKYGIKGPLWQRRSYDHILRKEETLEVTADYILNNPVRRGIVEEWNQYPFSGYLDDFDRECRVLCPWSFTPVKGCTAEPPLRPQGPALHFFSGGHWDSFGVWGWAIGVLMHGPLNHYRHL